jgi:hypothetical protein
VTRSASARCAFDDVNGVSSSALPCPMWNTKVSFAGIAREHVGAALAVERVVAGIAEDAVGLCTAGAGQVVGALRAVGKSRATMACSTALPTEL